MLGPLLLTLLGLAALFVPLQLGLPDPPDAVPLLLILGGAAWGWTAWRRQRRKGRLAWALGQTVVGLGVAWWMLVFSAYGVPGEVPAVGQRAPDISAVRVRDGATFHLAAERGSPVLLVFFRGAW